MYNTAYLDKFQKSLEGIDLEKFRKNHLNLKLYIWLNSVVLKIQKKSWLSNSSNPFETSVFFSVLISDELIKAGRLSCKLHALKLRELSGYKIKGRDFA